MSPNRMGPYCVYNSVNRMQGVGVMGPALRERTAQVVVADHAEGRLVTITGVIDVHSAADLRGDLHALIDDGRETPLLLDLGRAEIADATGLGLLLECHRRGRRHGRQMRLVAVSDGSERLFRRLALRRQFAPRPAYR